MNNRSRALGALLIALACAATAAAQPSYKPKGRLLPEPPDPGDRTFDSAREYLARVLAAYDGNVRRMPLDVKAEFLEWSVAQYHLAPYGQMHVRVRLPKGRNGQVEWRNDSDNSTWQGALLSALSYKYAVTRDERTLRILGWLVRSLHTCFEVTQTPGLVARCVMPESCADYVEGEEIYEPRGGRRLYFKGDAAKGGYNQIAGGYAHLFMLVGDDLPKNIERLARRDATRMVLHLMDHDYRLTDRHGRRTTYGDLTPELAGVGVPFNAQVVYQILALGAYFPPDDPHEQGRITDEFNKFRRRHPYYEDPLVNLIRPQEVAASLFIKGMNDVNHVTNAAFVGLELDYLPRRARGSGPDGKFTEQLGQTIYYSMQNKLTSRNALCNFMWAALMEDRELSGMIVGKSRQRIEGRTQQGLVNGFEQLKRYNIDRFMYEGELYQEKEIQWCDASWPDTFYWKAPPQQAIRITGPATSQMIVPIDYLYAYWLARYYKLDRNPTVVRQYGDVVGR